MSSIGAGCTDTSSFTNLNPDGPPAIAEVRLKETYTNTNAPTTFLARRTFAFGTYPDATQDEDHAVTTASVTNQSMRIIMDELLVGNALEEIQCRGVIDGDSYDSVPAGATPDDIAACSVNDNALKASCSGPHAVCLCHIEAGCAGTSGAVAFGDPVGVLDVNQDGAADNTSFKAGAVGISCQNGAITVPIDLDASYWNPSGNQQVPAAGGYDALGPAIILVPANGGVLPTNATCGLTFADDVLDKQNNRVCAPTAGRPASCTGAIDECSADLECTPGDVSAFSFGTEALRISALGVTDGEMNVSIMNAIFIGSNAPLDPSVVTKATITPSAGVTITQPMPTQLKIAPDTTFAPSTLYKITIPTTVTDTFGQPLPAEFTLSFTTGTM
ncbi:MAG: Ig-like domain-containing protein [Kofleriaceae bacterium]